MKIIDLENKSGLDRATIRYYEKEGMITPVRQENGYREYSDDDLQNLLKIKLLRLLGMPLSKIRELQRGNTDFQSALRVQIKKLEEDRNHAQRSAQICKLMQTDGITYAGLNADYYLNKYKTTGAEYPQRPFTPIQRAEEFHEVLPREYHPFRHLMARYLDLALLAIIIPFVQVVFFRTRLETLVIRRILLLLLWIPLEALCYSLFGTTPGKWAFGIRVDHRDGGKLDIVSAIKRSFLVYRYGMGWGIPIWRLWRQYKSFKNYDESELELEWNYDSEVSYHSFWRWRDKAKPVVVLTVFIAMVVTTFTLLNMPKYFGNDLTLQQFTANYNAYLTPDGGSSHISMNDDGTFAELDTSQDVVISIGGREGSDYADLEYLMEGERIRGFTCTDRFAYKGMFSVFETQYTMGIKAILAAQPGENTKSAEKFLRNLMSELNDALNNGENSVKYENEHIIVHWSISYEAGPTLQNVGGVPTLFDTSEDEKTVETYIRVELK